MKKVLLLLSIYILSTTVSEAQSLSDKYNAQRPVIIVCDWDKPPYEYLDDKGQPSGSNVDVLNAVMHELNIPCKFVMKEWTIALKTFERGDADIILANAHRYRKEPYVVSENIVNYNRLKVAMHSDSVGMVSLKQLEREGAVFKQGDYSAYYFMDGDSLSSTHLEFQAPKAALMGLINGDYKYYIWGEEPLKWKIKELNLEGITLNDVGLPISELHIVGRDRQLVEEIDDQYSRLKQSGEISVLQNKWFHPERIQDETKPFAFYVVITALLFIVFIYLFNRLARAHVRASTRQSTELNEMMYKALHMGNFIVMEYDIRNDRFTNKYGQVLPDKGLTLEEFTLRIHPDQQKEFRQKMQSLMDGRERRFELDKRWNAGTDDEPTWLIFSGHAISELDNDGRPAYIVNAIHDVTHELEEDKAARDLVHKYQVLSNIPFVAMSFYDKEGFLIDLNDRMKDLLGISDDNPDSKRFWETVSMFDAPPFKGVFTAEERNDMLFCQHMEYQALGLNEYIECHILPLFNADGEIVNYFISAFDVTCDRNRDSENHKIEREYRAIKQRISQQHERLKYLLVNSERFLMRSNIRQETISFFRSPETPEYTHSFEQFLNMIVEQDRDSIRSILYDTVTKTPRHSTIHMALPSEGLTGTVFDISFNPILNSEGEVIGHEGISSDITIFDDTCKKLEEETRLAADSVKLKSGFMASMTHELRTPLNAIVGFTGVLEALGDSTERAEYVRIIRNSSDMLQRLINDIIEVSSMTEGSITIKKEKVNFAAAFEDICMTLEQRVQEPEVTFIKENPYESFMTSLDIERIQQVLTNFVANAVKFTREGHIKVGYRYEREGLYLYCEDTGAGIPKEKQKMIFERFVKLDEFVQGTGMGLAICKSIAESSQGEIGVISEGTDKGSTFWVWIPCERLL
jgi:signal transduction histidine kinase/ABC-type amino acid transport substrate-binding protein